MKQLICVMATAALVLNGMAQTPTSWRGPNRNGIYPESGLLKKWPDGGPRMLWSFEELGRGHSSAVVDHGFVFTTGMTGETGYLYKFDLKGNLVYRKPYGPEFSSSYQGSRGTPTIVDHKVYLLSGVGNLYCLSNETGEILWSRDLVGDFGGKVIQWGMNETPVVDGDKVYITPGGRRHSMVALDRHTGDLIWSSPGRGQLAAYCTPLLFEHHGRKILATHYESYLVGFDASTGEMLWSQRQPNEWSVHPNTPIYHEGRLFYFSGYGQGGGQLELSHDGSSVTRAWTQKMMDSRMGGAVLVDGYLYGSGDDNRVWSCYNWETGELQYTSSAIAQGAVICADGMLYCYSQRGELALVGTDPSGFRVISQAKVTLGSEQHWAHPVIYNGVLYVRHGRALMAYKVS